MRFVQVAQIPGSAQRKICAKFRLTKCAGYGILEYSAQEERLRRDILSYPNAAVNRQFQQKNRAGFMQPALSDFRTISYGNFRWCLPKLPKYHEP